MLCYDGDGEAMVMALSPTSSFYTLFAFVVPTYYFKRSPTDDLLTLFPSMHLLYSGFTHSNAVYGTKPKTFFSSINLLNSPFLLSLYTHEQILEFSP